jgi:short subunit fatty acids transporter
LEPRRKIMKYSYLHYSMGIMYLLNDYIMESVEKQVGTGLAFVTSAVGEFKTPTVGPKFIVRVAFISQLGLKSYARMGLFSHHS